MNRAALIVGVGPGLGGSIAALCQKRFFRPRWLRAVRASSTNWRANFPRKTNPRSLSRLTVAARQKSRRQSRRRAELGAIGVLVYNASSSPCGGLLETSAEQFEHAWRIAALGVFLCARETSDMIAAGGGTMFANQRRTQL